MRYIDHLTPEEVSNRRNNFEEMSLLYKNVIANDSADIDGYLYLFDEIWKFYACGFEFQIVENDLQILRNCPTSITDSIIGGCLPSSSLIAWYLKRSFSKESVSRRAEIEWTSFEKDESKSFYKKTWNNWVIVGLIKVAWPSILLHEEFDEETESLRFLKIHYPSELVIKKIKNTKREEWLLFGSLLLHLYGSNELAIEYFERSIGILNQKINFRSSSILCIDDVVLAGMVLLRNQMTFLDMFPYIWNFPLKLHIKV